MSEKQPLVSWFKKNLTNKISNDNIIENQNVEEIVKEVEEPPVVETPQETSVFSKDQLDQINLDLVIAVEHIIKKRHLELVKIKDSEEQISNLENELDKYRYDKSRQEQYISELERRMSNKDDSIVNKQMSYDQLLEDFEDYQAKAREEIDLLKSKLAEEVDKYSKIVQEYIEYKHDSVKKESDYQEEIRILKVEKQELTNRYNTTVQEKNHLLQTIKEFTNRMSVPSFESKE